MKVRLKEIELTPSGGGQRIVLLIDSNGGIKKTFSSRNYENCSSCHGKGGEGKKTCSTCGGAGAVSQKFQTPFGVVAQQVTCPTCEGEGSSFDKVCSKCKGEGRVEDKRKIEIEIPSGVEDGTTLRLSGKGEVGRRGGTRGDLYVHIRVENSSKFERRGLDLVSILKIPVFDAIAGGTFEVVTFWGKVDLHVPEGTKDRQYYGLKERELNLRVELEIIWCECNMRCLKKSHLS
jgi:molecular chaperone DnaJ